MGLYELLKEMEKMLLILYAVSRFDLVSILKLKSKKLAEVIRLVASIIFFIINVMLLYMEIKMEKEYSSVMWAIMWFILIGEYAYFWGENSKS